MKTKSKVITCLSEVVRNDTITDQKHRLSKECRHQLKAQLYQQKENIDLNPEMKSMCSDDIKRECVGITPGRGQVLECLRKARKRLTPRCHVALFQTEQEEMQDSSVDYVLITSCKQMIQQFCSGTINDQTFGCLKHNKDEPTFDVKCKTLVVQRMIEQNSDFRLNPLLSRSCTRDIPKFCSHIVSLNVQKYEFEGKVIDCLKDKYRERKLSNECEQQIGSIIRESALNFRLNPTLIDACQLEIENCKTDDTALEDNGVVEECLKNAFNKEIIKNKDCQKQIARLIEDAKVDIHVDPILHRTCATDLQKFCGDVPRGDGRQLQCLENVLTEKGNTLEHDCQVMLSKRMEMFAHAAKIMVPETMEQLYNQVALSPSRKYFAVILMSIVGMIFIFGLFCGRVTKRIGSAMKNK